MCIWIYLSAGWEWNSSFLNVCLSNTESFSRAGKENDDDDDDDGEKKSLGLCHTTWLVPIYLFSRV